MCPITRMSVKSGEGQKSEDVGALGAMCRHNSVAPIESFFSQMTKSKLPRRRDGFEISLLSNMAIAFKGTTING